MLNILNNILDSYQHEMVMNLQKLIRIKSVLSDAAENAPFGVGIQKSLEFVLALGREKGFECVNFDNYACEINYGDGEKAVGAVSHLDVVPEGSGWTFKPFGGELVNGIIYGRGASDDKGPLIAVFYACCAIRDSGLPLRKKIKHIIGTNEETGVFPCIKYYKEHGQVPDCGIVPDAWFPAVYAEKGFLDFEFSKKVTVKSGDQASGGLLLLRLSGGEALNIVAPQAKAQFCADQTGKRRISEAVKRQKSHHRFNMEESGDLVTVTVTGQAAHASTPELGVNAISLLLCLLEELSFSPTDLCDSVRSLARKAGRDHDGTGLGIDSCDHTGSLTNNLGLLNFERDLFLLKTNIRSPITVRSEDLENKLKLQARSMGMECKLLNYNPHFYIPEDHPLVRTLTEVYREVTGDVKSSPKSHGGGSYARILDHFVPFGPSIEGEELCFHKQDEFISCERLLLLSKIYAEALYRLAK